MNAAASSVKRLDGWLLAFLSHSCSNGLEIRSRNIAFFVGGPSKMEIWPTQDQEVGDVDDVEQAESLQKIPAQYIPQRRAVIRSVGFVLTLIGWFDNCSLPGPPGRSPARHGSWVQRRKSRA